MLPFQHIPFLCDHVANIDQIFDDWRQYKLSVPTYGAIILSEDLKHVLLVQSFWAKSSWGFPKGKINETESPTNCAIREVVEETGFDISNLIDPNDFIESIVSDQFTRLYIIQNVPKTTVFQPQTRNEIKSCEWFPIEFLPTTRHDTVSKTNLGLNSNSFFMITPFVKRLKKFINDRQRSQQQQQQPQNSQQPNRQRHHSTSDVENLKRATKNTNGNGIKSTGKNSNKSKQSNGNQSSTRRSPIVETQQPIKILNRKSSDPEKQLPKSNRVPDSKRNLLPELEMEKKKTIISNPIVDSFIKKHAACTPPANSPSLWIAASSTPLSLSKNRRAPFPTDNFLENWKDFKLDKAMFTPELIL